MVLSEERKQHRGSIENTPNSQGWWTLEVGHYEVTMQNIIHVGDSEAGWVITRSTLNRNGVFLTSGLYDSGYHGAMAAVLHVTIAPLVIQRGTRIGQYLSFDAEMLHQYDGAYGFTPTGEARAEEIKYHDVDPVTAPVADQPVVEPTVKVKRTRTSKPKNV